MICPECQHDIAAHTLYGCYEGEAIIRDDELAALREKATLFDALANMRNIEITQDKNTWAIWRERDCAVKLLGSGATLEDAIKRAMAAAPLDATAPPR